MHHKLAYLSIILFFLALFLTPSYKSSLLSSGIYIDDKNFSISDFKNDFNNTNLLFLKESGYGIVTVIEEKDNLVNFTYQGENYELKINTNSFIGNLKQLKIDGRNQCGTGRIDIITNSLLGGLPIVLNKNGSALNIGLGCGLSLNVLEKGDFTEIKTIEINPVVIEAADYFNDINKNALNKSNSAIIIDDARNYLLKNEEKYDVIVNEPPLPYSSGSSSLVTKEFFSLAKSRLKEDGIMVQWVPAGLLLSCKDQGLESFYKTFSSVFPYNYVFLSKAQIPSIIPYLEEKEGILEAKYRETYSSKNPEWKYGELIIIGSSKEINMTSYLTDLKEIDKLKEKGAFIEYMNNLRIFNLNEYYSFNSTDILEIDESVNFNTDDNLFLETLSAREIYTLEKCTAKGIRIKARS